MGVAFTFFAFMWFIVTLAGNVVQGNISAVATSLTATLSISATTVNVRSTTGFPNTGVIWINDEHIAYASKTATTFRGNLATPLVRGAESTDPAAHAVGAIVRTPEGGLMNTMAQYNLAVIADASGLWAAVTVPTAVLRLIGSFLLLPISFLGSDLQIIGILWWVMLTGMLVSLFIAFAGGRRVS